MRKYDPLQGAWGTQDHGAHAVGAVLPQGLHGALVCQQPGEELQIWPNWDRKWKKRPKTKKNLFSWSVHLSVARNSSGSCTIVWTMSQSQHSWSTELCIQLSLKTKLHSTMEAKAEVTTTTHTEFHGILTSKLFYNFAVKYTFGILNWAWFLCKRQ